MTSSLASPRTNTADWRERFYAEREAHDETKQRASDDIAAMGLTIARLQQEVSRLKNAVAADRAATSKQDEELFETWKRLLGKNARTVFSDDRRRAIKKARKAMLEAGYDAQTTQARLLKVIEGGARFPFMVYGRWSATGSKNDRKDDLADFLARGKWMERLIELADAPPPTTHDRRIEPQGDPQSWAPHVPSSRSRVPRPNPPITEFIHALEHANCSPHVSDYSGQGNALCPAHDDTQPSLRFKEGDDGRVLVWCNARQCTHEAICAALGMTVADLFPNKKEV